MISFDLTALDNFINDAIGKAIKTHFEQLQAPNQTPQPDLSTYISKKQAAKIAVVSTSTIDNWRRAREFEPHYFGGSLRINRSEFMELLESKRLKTSNSY